MGDSKWRSELDYVIEKHLNELVRETKEFDYAISKSKNKGKAQLWVALALINAKLNTILHDKNKYKQKLSKEELTEVIKVLEKL